MRLRIVSAALIITTASLSGWTHAQVAGQEEAIIQSASAVFDETMGLRLGGIPPALRAKAEGIAIFPTVIKGGFIIGARHGKGVLLIRDQAHNTWHAPVFATITGGNVGFQAGLQSTDVVLVFTTKKSVQTILNGQFALGVDAAAAAGPVGRQASAATDLQLKAETYSYSRSRGLFAGVSLDGSVIQVDAFANGAYYHKTPQGQPIVPPSASALAYKIATYMDTGTQATPAAAPAAAAGAAPQATSTVPTSSSPTPRLAITGMSEADHLRDQLRTTAPELYERLSPEWRNYLSLPAEVFTGNQHPSQQELAATVSRFDQIAQDPRYTDLQQNPRFQSTYGLLRHYQSSLSQTQAQLQLPPPPPGSFVP